MKYPRGARGPRIDGQELRDRRILAGLSQGELARLARVDQGHLSRLENGERLYPAPRVTKAIAAALRIPMTALFAAEQAGTNQ